jgi:hypothetical protein
MQLLLSFISGATGLVAAWYWFRSALVSIDPSTTEHEGTVTWHVQKWVNSVMASSKSVAQLNQRAAIWTAVSVGAAAIASVWGALWSN